MPFNPLLPLRPGLLRAVLDSLHNEHDLLGGVRVTVLTEPLSADAIDEISVESSVGFGDFTEGMADAMLLVGGEIIYAIDKEEDSFEELARGLDGSTQRAHPAGTLVYDYSRNASAIDHVRRGFLLQFALGADLDVIGRNLGLHRCNGLTDAQWRELIGIIPYGARQPLGIVRAVLDVVFPDRYELYTLVSAPYTLFVSIDPSTSSDLRGRFFLNSAEAQLTTGLTEVTASYAAVSVQRVVLDTPLARLGFPSTDFYGAGSFVDNVITLGSSPGPAGTAVLVHYGAFAAHYLAEDFSVSEDGDYYAYLSDNTSLVACLLSFVHAAGIKIQVGIRNPEG